MGWRDGQWEDDPPPEDDSGDQGAPPPEDNGDNPPPEDNPPPDDSQPSDSPPQDQPNNPEQTPGSTTYGPGYDPTTGTFPGDQGGGGGGAPPPVPVPSAGGAPAPVAPHPNGSSQPSSQPAPGGPPRPPAGNDPQFAAFEREFQAWQSQYAQDQKALQDRDFQLKQGQLDLNRTIAAGNQAYQMAMLDSQNRNYALQAANAAMSRDIQLQDINLKRTDSANNLTLEREKADLQRRLLPASRTGRRAATIQIT